MRQPLQAKKEIDFAPSDQPMWVAQEHDGMRTDRIMKGADNCFEL